MVVEDLPVNFVFQSYHLMVAMFGMIVLVLALAFLGLKKPRVASNKWVQRLLVVSPVFPFVAIQSGWMVAEMGRQPWVVYPSTSGPDGVSLLTAEGVSASVTGVEVAITLALFALVYLFLFVAWVRLVSGFIKRGPEFAEATASVGSGAQGAAAAGAFSTGFGAGPRVCASVDGLGDPAVVGLEKGGE